MADFRFENLEVWKMSIEIGHRVADLADGLETSGKPIYAAKLRDRACSISEILAGGSGTPTKRDFSEYVGQARRATLEIANFVMFYGERELISQKDETDLISMLKRESKMLENFRQSLERAEQPVAETVESLV